MATLFSYFNRVKREDCDEDRSEDRGGGGGVDDKDSRSKRQASKSDAVGEPKKKRRIIIESDDSDGEWIPGTPDRILTSPEGVKESRTESSTAQFGNGNASAIDTPTSSSRKSKSSAAPSGRNEGTFPHDKLKWLQEDHLKDRDGRAVTHPDYNPRTLQVPHSYIRKLTPGFQQWWTIKADNFDSVIMFKVGKFYELYHMDAVKCVRELGLAFMKSDFAHCGFPEVAFGRYSNALVKKGYKVVRVEQMETTAMMEQRIKKVGATTKSVRVVNREVCSRMTRGTRTLSFFDGDCSDGESMFLLAIKELPFTESHSDNEYGVCFVDTCVGTIHIGQFKDDSRCSRLRTLLAHYPPAHLLYERRGLSSRTSQLIDLLLPSSIKDALVTDSEFWNAGRTLKLLAEGNYFEPSDGSGIVWPPPLKEMLEDTLGLSAAAGYDLAVSALGAVIWCLKRACIDHAILALARFEIFEPLDLLSAPVATEFPIQRLILDDVTLTNLDVLGVPGHSVGTLLEKLDHTGTPFGKRLLRRWLCAPLATASAIVARQDAVEQLMKNLSLVAQAKVVLAKLPDLERLLRKIHTLGCHSKIKDHPDSRAIFFDHVVYSKRKIADFISILDGLHLSRKLLDVFEPHLKSLDSQLLRAILTVGEGGRFPDLEKQLAYYENSFDRVKAKEEGIIVPREGFSPECDSSQKEVKLISEELDQYLKEQRKRLGCQTITYWGSGRNRFQLEVPESVLSKHRIDDYEMISRRKGFRRYKTPAISAMLGRLTAAEEKRDMTLRNIMGELFYSFDQRFSLWDDAVDCLAILDVLMSFATYSAESEQMCRPVIAESSLPFLKVLDGRHPCVGGDFIPNDVVIEGSKSCLLVTGPNMGGKSTLMRQTGLLVVLAQLGCHVPARSCRLSPVDRIFTRMGASDRIMAKESTFFVELKETSCILQHVSRSSLVLVDELGRGTATYDGAALASAVLQQLAKVECRTLFSTHYHFLVDEYVGNLHVQLGHMACMVEGEGEEESITFLYKLTEGACPKSYGFNVAQLAGLPADVIALARRKAVACEREAEQIRLLRRVLMQDFVISDLKDVHSI